MTTWEIVLVLLAAWFSLCACLVAGWIVLVELGRRSRDHQHGGYVKPPASSGPNHVVTRGQLGPVTTVSFSSRFQPGPASAAKATPAPRPLPNKPTARTSSGNATEDHGANGAPPEAVASPEKWSAEPGTWHATYPPWPHA